jgi:hypothetical protein
MPKYLYSSTLFYSGIFAAATTWDAVGKKQRREQWDRAISDLRQEIQQPVTAEGVEALEQHKKAVAVRLAEIDASHAPVGLQSSDAKVSLEGDPSSDEMLPYEQLEVLSTITRTHETPARPSISSVPGLSHRSVQSSPVHEPPDRRHDQPGVRPNTTQEQDLSYKLFGDPLNSSWGQQGLNVSDLQTPPEQSQATDDLSGIPQIYQASYKPFGASVEDEIIGYTSLRGVGPFEQETEGVGTLAGISDEDPYQGNEKQWKANEAAQGASLAPASKLLEDQPKANIQETGPTQTLEASEESLADQDVFRDVDPDRPRAKWPANTGPRLKRSLLPPQSIYAILGRQETARTKPWSQKKLANVNMSMEIFIYQLFLELHQRDLVEQATKAVPKDFAEVFVQAENALRERSDAHEQRLVALRPITSDREIENFLQHDESLEARSMDLCRYTQKQYRSNGTVQQSLNRSLRYLLNQRRHNQIVTSTLLAKIAYNLHLSSAPPGVQTYNILLLGFSVLKEHDLAARVIKSMDETKMRYNEVSFAAILDHYKNTNQPDTFIHTIKWMRGQADGPMLAHPNAWNNEKKRDLLLPKPEQPWKLLQLPYPTPYVFRAVLAGVTKFAGFDTALQMCQHLRNDGWGVSIAGFTILLKDCAERADWESGNAVWKNIIALKMLSRRRVRSVVTVEKIGMEAFAAMLRLALRCGRRDAYDEVWELARKTHPQPGLAGRIIAHVQKEEGVVIRGSTLGVEQNDGDGNRLGLDVRSVLEHGEDGDGTEDEEGRSVKNGGEPMSGYEIPSYSQDDRVSSQHRRPPDNTIPQPEVETYNANQPVAERIPLQQEQLLGHLPGGNELDDYELRERPMTLDG